jgi:hypothetical protein
VTNPRDRATDWEADIVQQFRSDAGLKQLVGERDTGSGRSLWLARAMIAAAIVWVLGALPALLGALRGAS